MDDKNPLDTLVTDSLMRCTKKSCSVISSGDELKETDGKCPHCGTQLAKPKHPNNKAPKLPFEI